MPMSSDLMSRSGSPCETFTLVMIFYPRAMHSSRFLSDSYPLSVMRTRFLKPACSSSVSISSTVRLSGYVPRLLQVVDGHVGGQRVDHDLHRLAQREVLLVLALAGVDEVEPVGGDGRGVHGVELVLVDALRPLAEEVHPVLLRDGTCPCRPPRPSICMCMSSVRPHQACTAWWWWRRSGTCRWLIR